MAIWPIEARGLRKVFGTTVALDGIDLRVEEGRILGLIGPNGAGKTTALNAILGLTSYEGELTVLGRDPWSARDQLMRDVSFIADVAVLPRWIRVSQLLDYVAGVHPRFDRAKAEGFLAKTTIKRTSKVRELSKGMVAQLHLALVMAIDAKLLVLDEPTLGLDILYRKQFYDSLLNDYFDTDRTIVVTTHQVEEIQDVLTDLMFIDRGRIVLECSMEEFESRYVEVMVNPEHVDRSARAQADARAPGVRPQRDAVRWMSNREQLAALGEVRTAQHRRLVRCGDEQWRSAVQRSEQQYQSDNITENSVANEYFNRTTAPEICQRVEQAGSATTPATRPFYWSVWRELWENRSIYIAPLIVAVVVLFGFIDQHDWSAGAQARGVAARPGKAAGRDREPYDVAAMMMIFTAFIVGVFYCLDALHGERRDRSILFWKSLPVSDLTTVLSKVIIPLVILPLVTFAIIVGDAVCHAAWTSVVLADERYGRRRPGRDFTIVSAMVDTALRLGRARALACADLRLVAAGFGLGAARDFSLGGVAAARDQIFEKITFDTSHFALDAEESPDRIRAGGFRLPGPT